MLKKALMTVTAAVAITAGASAIHTPTADATYYGYSYNKYAPVHSYGYRYGHRKIYRYGYRVAPVCYTKYKLVHIKFHTSYGPRFKTVYRPFNVCY